MNDRQLAIEAEQVLRFLQRRGLRPNEACGIMALAIASLMTDEEMARSFMVAFRQTINERLEVLLGELDNDTSGCH